MKNQSKGFTFKIAQEKTEKAPVKARDGVALAGCTMKSVPWGYEPAMNSYWGGHTFRDGGYWC